MGRPQQGQRHPGRGRRRRGGRHVYEGFVHTFYSLIPPADYFDTHPEWFSEIKGARTRENAQLCLTNEAMRREFVRNLKLRLRDNPAATIASVSQNDCHNNCTCPRCRAVDEEEGSPAGSLLRFVNAVAADIERDFPEVAIDTLAYQYTRKPPRITRPRPNVIVRLCSIECSFARPLDDPANKAFLEDIEGWSKIAGRLFIWDYTTNFSHYIQPHPNYGVLAPNIRLFVKNNVTGIFEQGAYQSWGSEMAELRAWVLAKLLWNPALDAAALRREFLTGYYGPAGEWVDRYLALLEAALADSGRQARLLFADRRQVPFARYAAPGPADPGKGRSPRRRDSRTRPARPPRAASGRIRGARTLGRIPERSRRTEAPLALALIHGTTCWRGFWMSAGPKASS